MKKILILTLLAALMGTGKMMAQSKVIADLRHNGAITYFYGSDALIAAYDAAVNGDTIALSEGTFNAVNITKAIVLQGTGMSQTTNITGNFSINIEEDGGFRFLMEDLTHRSNLTIDQVPATSAIVKCRLLGNVTVNDEMTFSMCRIKNSDCTLFGEGQKNLNNCYVFWKENTVQKNITVINCVIHCEQKSNFGSLQNASFINCIFSNVGSMWITYNPPHRWYNSAYLPPSTADYQNCVAVNNYGSDFFTNIAVANHDCVTTEDNIFNDSDEEVLTESAAATYMGLDGTQVGMYGGPSPINEKTANPLITKFEVASKAVNGKVSVNVEVNVGE